VLLPDATVLNSGGGEYSPKNNGQENDPKDSHRDAQIFSPPYLFKADGSLADRPDITSAPADVAYAATITVGTSHPDQIDKVNWIRASSVTHSFNTNQRLLKSTFTAGAAGLSVTAPADPKVCPPGHYLLFLLNKDGVPSVAKIIQIHP
jgi:galactose oxidase